MEGPGHVDRADGLSCSAGRRKEFRTWGRELREIWLAYEGDGSAGLGRVYTGLVDAVLPLQAGKTAFPLWLTKTARSAWFLHKRWTR